MRHIYDILRLIGAAVIIFLAPLVAALLAMILHKLLTA